jgi:hypothetical protein
MAASSNIAAPVVAIFSGGRLHRGTLPRMLALDRTHLVRTLATQLSEMAGTWTPDGDTVRSDGKLITVTDLHGGPLEPNHVDIGVALNADDPTVPVLWDCAAGVGETSQQVAEMAASMWVRTTGSTVLELLTRQGDFATHIPGDDPDGLPGFHVIHSPMLSFGGDSGTLGQWVRDHPLVPALRATLPPHLDEPLNGVKVLFGSAGGEETVEVRVNGVVREDATAAVRTLDWPRIAFVRAYLIIFPEG